MRIANWLNDIYSRLVRESIRNRVGRHRGRFQHRQSVSVPSIVERLDFRRMLSGTPTTTIVSASSEAIYGQSETFTATVSSSAGTPNAGLVTFFDGTTTLGTGTVSNGTATLTTNALTAGVHSVTASYGGSVSFAESNAIFILTVAGDGTAGSGGDNGPAALANLSNANGVAVDSAGDLFIADTNNSVVREVNAITHVITTYAGGGSGTGVGATDAFGDGLPATEAGLLAPEEVALDAAGDLFIADYGDNLVREVNATTHIITTVAGNGTFGDGGDGGSATLASVGNPVSIAVDSSGNLFICEYTDNVIREVNATTHIISTVAGQSPGGYSGDNGPATAAELSVPYSIALDSAGDLFISDRANNVIREVNATTQVITTVVGNGIPGYSGDNGVATSAELSEPDGIALDSAGDLFISDAGNNVIREVNATTHVITTTLIGTIGPNLAIDSTGDLFLAEGNQVQEVVSGTAQVEVVKATPTVTAIDPNGIYNGTAFSATASVTGLNGVAVSGTETYTYYQGGGTTGTALPSAPTDPGTYTVVAAFTSSDPNYANASSMPLEFVIIQTAATTTIVRASSVATTYGQTETFTATVSSPVGAPNAGTVTFFDGATMLGTETVSNGTATLTTNTLPAGTHVVTALYGGSGSFEASRSRIIQDVAGNYFSDGDYGGDNGQATAAGLVTPGDVAVDSAGNLYIADAGDNRIREVNATTHVITTIVGNGAAGYSGDNGPATAAELSGPGGIALDAAGDLFIFDVGNDVIREVNAATHVITTFAGNGIPGGSGDNGPATAAELFPGYLAVDSAGDLFISARYGNTGENIGATVREVNATTHLITTVAGNEFAAGYTGDNGPATAAELDEPSGLAVDSEGDLFISDSQNNVIREVNAITQVITTVAGNGFDAGSNFGGGYTGDNGPAIAAELYFPEGITVDSAGDLFIADFGNNVVREVNATTQVITTVAGNGTQIGGNSPATDAELNRPLSLAVDSAGSLFINDEYNVIREVMNGGVTVTVGQAATTTTVIASAPSTTYGQTETFTATVSSSAGTPNAGLVTFLDGTTTLGTRTVSNGTATLTTSTLPAGIDFVTASYSGSGSFQASRSSLIQDVAGQLNNDVYSGDNGLATAAGLSGPDGVAVDSVGNLYIADAGDYRIREVNAATHVITTIAGNGISSYGGFSGNNGPATAAELAGLGAIALDAAGDLFIVNSTSNGIEILEVNATTHVITTVAGNGQSGDSFGNGNNGPATSAELYASSIAVDSAGDLFISEYQQLQVGQSFPIYSDVREVNATTHLITTVAGTGISGYSGDSGPATAAELNGPEGLAVDSAGDLFISDSNNERIREVNAITHVITTVTGNGFGTGTGQVVGNLYPNPIGGYTGDNGPATSAELYDPQGLTLDSAGDLFIADFGNNVVREVNATTKVITTVAESTGPLAVDSAGNLFISSEVVAEEDSNGHSFIGGETEDIIQEVTVVGVTVTVRENPTVTAIEAGGPYDGSPYSATVSAIGLNGITVNGTTSFTYYQGSGTAGKVLTSAPTDAGTYTVVAAFTSTDPNYANASSLPLVFVITQVATTTMVTASALSTTYGQSETFTATVSSVTGTPNAGTVTFYDGTTVIGSPVAVSNGTATLATTGLPSGLHVITAKYSGATDFGASNSTLSSQSIIESFAGNGTAGFSGDNGTATSAELYIPMGVAIDTTGNLFIADAASDVVREVNATTHLITTVAGNGTAGYVGDGGKATTAELNGPTSIALDQSGDLFIVDRENNVVRKVVLSTGIISTIAGNGVAGYIGSNGAATSAELNNPFGIAIDTAGNLFIADSGNNAIREVNATTQKMTTVAGNGTPGYTGDNGAATSAELKAPYGIAVDAAGDLFVADSGNNVIREVNGTTHTITTVAGNGSAGNSGNGRQATSAELNYPFGIVVDTAGDLFIADSSNYSVKEVYASTHVIAMVAGNGLMGKSGNNGAATAARLDTATNVALDASGDLFIADAFNSEVREVVNNVLVTVTPATPTVTAIDAGGANNGTPYSASFSATGVNGATVNGTATYAYYSGSGTTGPALKSAPSSPGTYTVVAAFASSDPNYSSASSTPLIFTITSIPAPTLSGMSATEAFVKGSIPLPIAPNIIVTQAGGYDIAGATVTITNWVSTEDRLTFNNSAALQNSFIINANGTAVLTLTGNATAAAYQTELQSIVYQDVNDNLPILTARPVSIAVNNGSSNSNTVNGNIVVQNVDLPPVVSAIEATPLAYTANSTPVAISGTLLVNDPDSANLSMATMQITSGYQNNASGHDVLSFVNQNGITGSFNAATGTLTLTGDVAVGYYRLALRSVTFSTSGSAISTAARTLTIIATDDYSPTPQISTPVTRNITVTVSPVTLSGFSGTQTFVKGSAPMSVAPSLVITDSESADLSSAIVTLTNWVSNEDRLTFYNSAALQNSFIVNSNGTAILTLTGNATLAQYQTELQSIVYQDVNNNQPILTARPVSITVNDGTANSNTVNGNIAVQNVNLPPVLSAIETTPLVDTANSMPLPISATLLANDPDAANLSSATVQISSGYQNDAGGHDVLSFVNQNGITGSFNATTSTLTLTGPSAVGNYRIALRSITFSTSGTSVSAATRTLTITATDTDSIVSTPITRNVTVSAPLTLSGLSSTDTFVKGSAPMPIAANLVLSDSAGVSISSATVTITNWTSSEDRLNFYNSAALQHTFTVNTTNNTGTLTLTGGATPAQYQTTLQSITYQDVQDNLPVLTAREVSITVNDGNSKSTVAAGSIAIQNVDLPPVVSGIETTPLVYAADHPEIPPQPISGTLTVNDPDSTNLSQATVQITSGYQSNAGGQDLLSFVNQYGITGSFAPATGTLTLTGDAGVGYYRLALESVMFSTSGTLISTATRTLTITVHDDYDPTPAVSSSITRNIAITTTNASPTLSGFSETDTYVKGSVPITVAPNMVVADSDSADLFSATVTITNWQSSEDRLSFYNSAALQHTFVVNTNTNTATLTLTGEATLAQYQTTLQSITYQDVEDNVPVLTPREVSITVNDGHSNSNVATASIAVQNVDLPPVLTGIGSTPVTYIEDSLPDPLWANITIDDPDSPTLGGATVQITSNYQNNANSHDVLSFVPQHGITGSFNPLTGTLTMTGTTLVINYETAIRSVEFSSSGTAVSTLPRSLTIAVEDGSIYSALLNRTVVVDA